MDGDRTPAQSNSQRWLTRALWVLAIAGLLYLAGLTVWLGVTGLFFPYQLDYGEGTHLYYVKQLLAGQPIYRPIGSYPYITSNYAPLPFLLAIALTPILGVTYAAGRIWTLLAIVAITAIIVVWVRRETGRWLPVAVAALAFLASPYVYHWAPLFRVDLIGLALTLGGLYAVYRATPRRTRIGTSTTSAPPKAHIPQQAGDSAQTGGCGLPDLSGAIPGGQKTRSWANAPQQAGDSARTGHSGLPDLSGAIPGASETHSSETEQGGGRWLLWLAVVLFVAALYAKQSFVFAPAAALAYLVLVGRRRQAMAMAAGIGLLGGGIFLALNALTGGSFWQSMVVANVNPFLWTEFWQQQGDFFGTFALLALLAAWYVADKFVLDRELSLRDKAELRPIGLLDLYLPAALLSVLLAGKAGAWENYFFEALAALALCAGLGLARLMEPRTGPISRIGPVSVVAPLLVIGQVVLMWHTPRIASRYLALTRWSYEGMAPILANTPDPIFSEDMGLQVTYDKVLDYHSFEYSQLAQTGRWDQAWELDQLRNRRRSMVILEQGTRLDVDHYRRFTRAFLSELDRSYRHSRTVGKYELYVPDPLQHERRAEFGDQRVGDQLALVGWSLHAPPDLQPGDTISLTVVWQAQRALTTGYTAFAHLVDESGRGWAGDDHAPYDGLYPTSAWGAGEMVRDTFTLTVPSDAPPGLYDIQVGWYDPASQQRLPVGDGTSFRVAVLPLAWPGTGPELMTGLDAHFGQAITLQGYRCQVVPGGVQVTLRWTADGYTDTDYTVFVHLVGLDGEEQAISQGDAPPLAGRWPTYLWLPGVTLDDVHTIPLPADLPPRTYQVLVGLYNPVTGSRLRLTDGSDAMRLAEIPLP
jgi:hypothetical protein